MLLAVTQAYITVPPSDISDVGERRLPLKQKPTKFPCVFP